MPLPVRLSQLANLDSQPDLPTGIFSLPNKSNLAFSKAFGSENYRLTLSGEKHLATAFATSKFRKNTVDDFNATAKR